MVDPRAVNCQQYTQTREGLVTGVELVYQERPNTLFKLLRVDLIPEAEAQRNTVATCLVVDSNGIPLANAVSLAWPFPDLTNFALAGNQQGQHFISNKYYPPSLGPLALCIRDGNTINSDVIGGLGLPFGHHVSFRATFQIRTAGNSNPTPLPTNGAIEQTLKDISVTLVQISKTQDDIYKELLLLGKHLGHESAKG